VVVPGMEAATEKLSQIENTDAQHAVASVHAAYLQARREVLTALCAGMLIAVGLALLVSGSIIGRLRPIARAMDAVAVGDLTHTVPVNGRDEIGMMAQAANQATSGVRQTVGALVTSADRLSRSSEQLTTVTDNVVSDAAAVSERAHAADGSAALVSQDLQTIATGAEQMAASIQEIAHSANEGSRVASQAVAVVGATNQTVSKLGESSQEIGNVVKLITSIAEQTNLLALNATIEAARAGEAGKGFAVVASEVKDLAQETAKATDVISRRVQAIQADTESAVTAIAEISGIIEQINNYQMAIASAVEEQTRTTGEMNRNVANAASGAAQIAEHVSQVTGAAESTTRSVAVGRQAASDLAHLASELHGLVSHFTA
jgi:methyl-accepting chemotaxis protein